ncbi:MAG: amidohydrolase family protein, partial [Coriobacteriales bacterium]|nr:amidohydrolase family protein [Coriobacteriales bacterium]
IAGITKDTPDPIPNVQFYMRDENGEPTGYCIENKPLNAVFGSCNYIKMDRVFPCLAYLSGELCKEGITTSAEVGTYDFIKTILNDDLRPFIESDDYKGRVICCGDIAADPDIIEEKFQWCLKWQKEFQSDKLKLNFFKMLSDGTFENGSAACPNPFPQSGKQVAPVFSEDQEFEYIIKSYENGLDINIHAIGPDAVHRMLMAAGRAREAGAKDIRITMSHSQFVYDEDIELFAKYDIFSNSTPVWTPRENKEQEDMIYSITQANSMPLKRLKDAGVKLGFGSDFPTDPSGFNVFNNIECGITRQPLGLKDFYIADPDERLTLDDMIAGYTINNAYQIHMEDKIGSIEVGKYADMIVLDQNLFDIDVYTIHDVKVLETIVNGETCYKA